MRVHLFTSWSTIDEREDDLRAIMDAIKNHGHTLATDCIQASRELRNNPDVREDDWVKVYKQNLEDIAKSDVIIAEASSNSFAVGYQVASAIHQKKPILILRHAETAGRVYAEGVVDNWVIHQKYGKSPNDLEEIIAEFLNDNDIQTKDMRFNFFIDRPIYNYLRWTSLKTGKTKAEILRELVEREIDRSSS